MKTIASVGLAMFVMSTWAMPPVGMPTPTMSEDEMTVAADIVVEGTITDVALLKRWMGERLGSDIGYEYGLFQSTLRISRVLKGRLKVGDTVRYVVQAYKEGKWDDEPARQFVYEGTKDAITPATKLRVFLKWNAEEKRYERVHFNSGFVVLEPSDKEIPTTVVPEKPRG